MPDAPKTVVYQSYRTTDVAPWIERCMASVKSWTEAKGYDYRFYDDVMFTYAPGWYRDRVKDNVLLVSDLARLKIGKELLESGYERVIWMDADVLIFDPDRFEISVDKAYAFCYETWLDLSEKHELQASWRVNNAVSVFCQGNSFLDFYIQACLDIVEKKQNFGPWYAGTVFLTMLRRIYPFELLKNVGMIGPFLMRAILQDKQPAKKLFAEVQDHPVYAGNLCGSYAKEGYKDIRFSDTDYDQAVSLLLETKGKILGK